PAHVDATDEPGLLRDGVTARTADGVVQGTLVPTGSYGPVLGNVVGLVDDTWGRLLGDVVDLGAPFRGTEPSVSPVSKVTDKSEIERRIGSLRSGIEMMTTTLEHFAKYGRDAEPHLATDSWLRTREGIANIDSVLGFGKLPSEFTSSL